MKYSCQIIRTCAKLGIPAMFENSGHSMMWIAPPLKILLSHSASDQFLSTSASSGPDGASVLESPLGTVEPALTCVSYVHVKTEYALDLVFHIYY